MVTAQISLSDAQSEALRMLAQTSGKTEDQLLQEAIEHFLRQAGESNRLTMLRQAKGIWKDRSDLPELRELRAELVRKLLWQDTL